MQPLQQPLQQRNTASALAQPANAPLVVYITKDPTEIRMAMQLRYRIFAEDMGARIDSGDEGIDQDRFDEFCHHLIVKDPVSGSVVGYSRILTSETAKACGGFYSETEFVLDNILNRNLRLMEIGRTCVDPNFRSGAVIGLLWSGIGQFLLDNNIDCLMGCASISLADGGARALAIINYLRENCFTEESLRVTPRTGMPQMQTSIDGKSLIPPLLKTYLRIGAKVCGEACLDRDFNVADVLILLDREQINPRYMRHFVRD